MTLGEFKQQLVSMHQVCCQGCDCALMEEFENVIYVSGDFMDTVTVTDCFSPLSLVFNCLYLWIFVFFSLFFYLQKSNAEIIYCNCWNLKVSYIHYRC